MVGFWYIIALSLYVGIYSIAPNLLRFDCHMEYDNNTTDINTNIMYSRVV